MKYFGLSQNDFNVPKTTVDGTSFATILGVVFAIAGAVAVIVIMLAGLKYVTSRGDPASVAKAKNAIIYALIGLVVCILAFTIVNYVVKSV